MDNNQPQARHVPYRAATNTTPKHTMPHPRYSTVLSSLPSPPPPSFPSSATVPEASGSKRKSKREACWLDRELLSGRRLASFRLFAHYADPPTAPSRLPRRSVTLTPVPARGHSAVRRVPHTAWGIIAVAPSACQRYDDAVNNWCYSSNSTTIPLHQLQPARVETTHDLQPGAKNVLL